MLQTKLYIVAGVIMALLAYVVSTRCEYLDNATPTDTMESVNKDIAYLKGAGFKDDGTSKNDTMKRLLAKRAELSGSSTPAGVAPPITATSGVFADLSRAMGSYAAGADSASVSKAASDAGNNTMASAGAVLSSTVSIGGIVGIVIACLVAGIAIVLFVWRTFVSRSSVPSTMPLLGRTV